MKILNSKQRGFSMIEAMIALAALSVGLISLAKFEANLQNSGNLSKARSAAVKLAQERMETLRNNIVLNDYDNLEVLATPDFVDDPDYTDGNINGLSAVYHRSYKLEDGPVSLSKLITVKVSWTDAKHGNQDVQLNSIIKWDKPKASARLAKGNTGGIHGPGTSPAPPAMPPGPPPVVPGPEPGPEPEPAPEPAPVPEPPASYSATVVGIISYNGNISKDWTVAIDGVDCATGIDAGSYSCNLNGLSGSHSFTISISSTGSTCGTSSSSKTVTIDATTATQNFSHAKNSGQCV